MRVVTELVSKIVLTYIEFSPGQIEQMLESLAAKHWKELKQLAHSIKSSSANMGAMKLADYAQSLETTDDQQLDVNAWQLVGQIRKEFLLVVDELEKLLKELQVDAHLSNIPDVASHLRILLVDDDPLFSFIISMSLSDVGFEVDVVSSGEECLPMLEHNHYDLILLDVVMEETSAFETCRILRLIDSLKFMPILMVTGLDDAESIEESFNSGANGFVFKPLNFPILIQMIRFHIQAGQVVGSIHLLNEQLEQVQKIARLGYWIWDDEKAQLRLSNFLAQMLKLKQPLEYISLNEYLEYIHPQDRKMVEYSIQGVSNDLVPDTLTYRVLNNNANGNNEYLIFSQKVSLDSLNKQIVIGTVLDITKQV